MSLDLADPLPRSSTPTVEDDDQQSVGSEASQEILSSNNSEVGHDEPQTEPSSPEPTEPVNVGQGENCHILAEDPFDSEASRALFEAIDRFQSCGVGKYTDLDIPQLVIVGGQSVGKSSLLQSLTDIPFPVGEKCCTRFATRIVSRRTAPGTPNKVKISIVSPDFALGSFGSTTSESNRVIRNTKQYLGVEEFTKIVEEASTKYMDIRPGKGEGKKNFAEEVLKIEVSGPSRSHFSILDIPGVFVNDYNVQEEEMEGVDQLVIEYMKRPENIVICVADSCVDLSNQRIFKLANKNVPKERLIGVFTKCDRTDAADSVAATANGAASSLGDLKEYDWFVVRNKTNADNNNAGFNLVGAENKLFRTAPWNSVRESRRGSSMLKKHLGELLCARIRHVFPDLLSKLQLKLADAESRRDALGNPRDTTQKRRTYLVDIATRYQTLTTAAVKEPWELNNAECTVRPVIRAANESFAEEMRNNGHSYEFEDQAMTEEECIARLNDALNLSEEAEGEPSTAALETFQTSSKGSRKGRDGHASSAGTESSSAKPLFDTIRQEVEICSSTQLPGMVHPDIVQRLYKLQTAKWHNLAQEYINSVAYKIGAAADALLCSVMNEGATKSTLYGNIVAVLLKHYNEVLSEALESLKKYSDGDRANILQTTDPGFMRKLQLLRSLRMARSIQTAQRKLKANWGLLPPEELGKLVSNECHFSSTANTVLEIHDILKVYYEVSLQSFIHFVTNVVGEALVTHSEGSLKVFSPAYIYSLPDAEVDRLGRESSGVAEEREQLARRIKMLQRVRDTAQAAMNKATI